MSGGQGNSGAPGSYFWVGIGCAVGALLAAAFGSWLTTGILAFAALVFVGWSFMATTEGYGNRCVECDNIERTYPWSL
jgi:hypothetical protein